jgi:hypothetical protein
MKNLSEQIDDKYVKDKVAQEKSDKEYTQREKDIGALITIAFKGAVDIVGNRIEMSKTHEQMYNFSFNLSSKNDTFGNKITSYIYTSNLFDNTWEFNKNTYTFFRSAKSIDINNLKNELVSWIEDLVKQTKILD